MLELLDHLWFGGEACEVALVRDAIAAARPTSIRHLLTEVVDTGLAAGDERDDVINALDRYAGRLAYDGEFRLAAHVYRVMIDAASEVDCTWLLPSAYQHRASCLREDDDADGAMESYARGLQYAVAINDDRTALRIRIGRSNLLRSLGKLEDARADLDDALKRARLIGDADVIGRAAHELGICFFRLGRYIEALVCYSEAFGMFAKRRDRHRLLNDIGRALEALGLLDAARNAWLAVYRSRKSEAYARFASAVNLMALAQETRDRVGFDLYRTVPRTRMPLRLLLAFYFELGEGHTAFRQRAESREAYERAAKIAKRMHREDEAERALRAMKNQRSRPVRRPAPMMDLPVVVRELLADVDRLRLSPDVPLTPA